MTSPRDPDEILASWLDEGPTRLPDQTRRAIAVALPTTTRRGRGWIAPWRTDPMHQIPRLLVGGVAALVILVGGAYLLTRSNDSVVGTQPSPVAPSAPASQAPASAAAVIPIPPTVFAMSPGIGDTRSWLQTAGTGAADGKLPIDVAGDLADPDWSPDGQHLAFTAKLAEGSELWTSDADGANPVRISECHQPCSDIYLPAWSPDGTQIAFTEVDVPTGSPMPSDTRIVILTLATGVRSIVTSGTGDTGPADPRWSPDGTQLAYWMVRTDQGGNIVGGVIHIIGVDGTRDRSLTDAGLAAGNPDWSPDGRTLVFVSNNGNATAVSNLYTIGVDGTNLKALTNLSVTASKKYMMPRWSPDGSRIVYYLEPLNGPGSIAWMAPDGSDQVVIFAGGGRVFPSVPDIRGE